LQTKVIFAYHDYRGRIVIDVSAHFLLWLLTASRPSECMERASPAIN
jgi:uncharacterized protein (DUF3820 family)